MNLMEDFQGMQRMMDVGKVSEPVQGMVRSAYLLGLGVGGREVLATSREEFAVALETLARAMEAEVNAYGFEGHG